jgi:hypothetical protein
MLASWRPLLIASVPPVSVLFSAWARVWRLPKAMLGRSKPWGGSFAMFCSLLAGGGSVTKVPPLPSSVMLRLTLPTNLMVAMSPA